MPPAKTIAPPRPARRDDRRRGGAPATHVTDADHDWRNGSGEHSNLPCMDCQRLLCIAMSECEHQTWLCKDDDEPEQLTQDDWALDANGSITPSARLDLERKMM